MTITDLIIRINERIKEHENTAEEYFQEIDDPDRGNEELAKIEALREVFKFITE